MEFHEAANIFPMLTGDDFRELVEDIRTEGQKLPIILYDGKILDGRNRYAACLELGIEPWCEEYTGDNPYKHVASLNIKRRHLTKEQRIAFMRQMREHGAKYEEIAQAAGVSYGTAYNTTRDVNINFDIENDRGQQRPASYTPRETQDYDCIASPDVGRRYDEWKADPSVARRIEGADRDFVAQSPPKTIDNPALYTSNSEEWYTPKHIVDRVVKLFGAIGLDPCSNPGEPRIPAERRYTQADDGLAHEWTGKVYMNPPYGREIAQWIEYLCGQYESGNVTEAIALVPSRTDTAWFGRMRNYLKCFVTGRLSFSDSDTPAPFPSMVVYMGENERAFIEIFSEVGDVYERCA